MMISQKTWPPGGGVSFLYMEYKEKTFRFYQMTFFSATTGRKAGLALNHFLQVARGLLTSKLREPLTKNGSPENVVSELRIGNKCYIFLFKI